MLTGIMIAMFAHFLDLFENVADINFVNKKFKGPDVNLETVVEEENKNSKNAFLKMIYLFIVPYYNQNLLL